MLNWILGGMGLIGTAMGAVFGLWALLLARQDRRAIAGAISRFDRRHQRTTEIVMNFMALQDRLMGDLLGETFPESEAASVLDFHDDASWPTTGGDPRDN